MPFNMSSIYSSFCSILALPELCILEFRFLHINHSEFLPLILMTESLFNLIISPKQVPIKTSTTKEFSYYLLEAIYLYVT